MTEQGPEHRRTWRRMFGVITERSWMGVEVPQRLRGMDAPMERRDQRFVALFILAIVLVAFVIAVFAKLIGWI